MQSLRQFQLRTNHEKSSLLRSGFHETLCTNSGTLDSALRKSRIFGVFPIQRFHGMGVIIRTTRGNIESIRLKCPAGRNICITAPPLTASCCSSAAFTDRPHPAPALRECPHNKYARNSAFKNRYFFTIMQLNQKRENGNCRTPFCLWFDLFVAGTEQCRVFT